MTDTIDITAKNSYILAFKTVADTAVQDKYMLTFKIVHNRDTNTIEIHKDNAIVEFKGYVKKYLKNVKETFVIANCKHGILLGVTDTSNNSSYVLIQGFTDKTASGITDVINVNVIDAVKSKHHTAVGVLERKKCTEIYIVGGLISSDKVAVNSYKIKAFIDGYSVKLLKPTNTIFGNLEVSKGKVVLRNSYHKDNAVSEWVESDYTVVYDKNMEIIETIYKD